MRRPLFTASMITALALPLAAQAPPRASQPAAPVTINGRVVDDTSGAPISRVRVAVTPAFPGAPLTLTDADGRFSFTTTSSRPTVEASKAGYATIRASAQPGAPFDIRLPRGAAIEGRVIDQLGDGAVSAPVVVQAVPGPGSRRAAEADDRGAYRIGGLPPGTYRVVVMRRVPTGYSEDTAQTVTLEPGDVRDDLDFVVPPDRLRDRIMRPQSQEPMLSPTGTGIVRGSVVTGDGRPVPHANVVLSTSMRIAPLRDTFTDMGGRFEFTGLATGTYQVIATKALLRPASALRSEQVSVAEGNVADVALRLDIQDGAIEGDVSDEDGEPLQDVTVQALEVRYERGARRLVPSWSSRVTDDRGHYRLFGLAPGEYVVTAAATGADGGSELPGLARSYYPGTPLASQAQFVSVTSGDTVPGINLWLPRARTFRVAGRLLDSSGAPSTGGQVSLVPGVRSGSASAVPLGARIGQDGTFEFVGVLPGQYVVHADRGRKGPATEGDFGSAAVTVVDRDVTGVVVQAMPGSSVRGRLVLDSASGRKLQSLDGIEISPLPVDFDMAPKQVASAAIHADGSFEMHGITGARRIQPTRVPPGWALKEVRAGGVDVTDRAIAFGRREQSRDDIEIVLTDRPSGVTGALVDGTRHTAGGVVILFATARDRWYFDSRYLARVATSENGSFTIAGVPPGSYYVAGVARVRQNDPDGWQDPQFLESLSRVAQSVVVRDGELTSIDVAVSAP